MTKKSFFFNLIPLRLLQGTLLSFFFILSSCFILQKPTPVTKNLPLYNPGKTTLHPDFAVYHNSGQESMLFFRLLVSEVVFNQANPQVKNQSRLTLSYTLYSSLANGEIAAQDTQSFFIDRESVEDEIVASLRIPTEPGKTYLMEVVLQDAIRQSSYKDLILVDRFSEDPQQNYMLLNYPGNRVGFERYYYPGESFRIIKRDILADRIHVSVFPPRNVLPLPPYSVEEQPDLAPFPDSTFTATWSEQTLFRLGGEGIYVFHFDPEKARGLCLTQFGESYPQIRLPADMLPPLQYLTTREEYQALVDQPDIKKAVDDFWIGKGKTVANARDLIRVFYNRVTFANIYFASTKAGWTTDRGMIYIILGPPARVEKSETREIWTYETAESGQPYTVEFNLTDDYWIGYDYTLKRTENHRIPWNMAVDSWRKGKIFSL